MALFMSCFRSCDDDDDDDDDTSASFDSCLFRMRTPAAAVCGGARQLIPLRFRLIT
jgi:hypothetical protein